MTARATPRVEPDPKALRMRALIEATWCQPGIPGDSWIVEGGPSGYAVHCGGYFGDCAWRGARREAYTDAHADHLAHWAEHHQVAP